MEEGEWRRIIHPDIEQLSLVEIELGLLPDGDIADGAHFLHEVDHEVLLLVPGDRGDPTEVWQHGPHLLRRYLRNVLVINVNTHSGQELHHWPVIKSALDKMTKRISKCFPILEVADVKVGQSQPV